MSNAFKSIRSEREAASHAAAYAGDQTKVKPNKDALVASTLIGTALKDVPATDIYKQLAGTLSKNTLRPWAKGAVLIAGTQAQAREVFGNRFADQVLFYDDKPRPFLMEIRRKYGDGWEASLQAAAFVAVKQREALHDGQWAKMPAGVTGFDPDHRGHHQNRSHHWWNGGLYLPNGPSGG